MNKNETTTTAKFHVGQLVTKITYGVNNGGGRFEVTAVEESTPGHFAYRVRREGGKGKGGLWNAEVQLEAI